MEPASLTDGKRIAWDPVDEMGHRVPTSHRNFLLNGLDADGLTDVKAWKTFRMLERNGKRSWA